jgi:hypothetical protein
MTTEWTIHARSHQCAKTGATFVEGQPFYTLLFLEKGEYRREDLCEDAFRARPEAPAPFSFWRSKFVPPPASEPEAVTKQTAEDLLRRYMEEQSPDHSNARYFLALMLERKRILKEVEVKREDGNVTRIYEHGKTGEVFVIPDPQLKLSEIEQVQTEVAAQLGGGVPAPATPVIAEPEPEPAQPS